jgi:hypothetical protein
LRSRFRAASTTSPRLPRGWTTSGLPDGTPAPRSPRTRRSDATGQTMLHGGIVRTCAWQDRNTVRP